MVTISELKEICKKKGNRDPKNSIDDFDEQILIAEALSARDALHITSPSSYSLGASLSSSFPEIQFKKTVEDTIDILSMKWLHEQSLRGREVLSKPLLTQSFFGHFKQPNFSENKSLPLYTSQSEISKLKQLLHETKQEWQSEKQHLLNEIQSLKGGKNVDVATSTHPESKHAAEEPSVSNLPLLDPSKIDIFIFWNKNYAVAKIGDKEIGKFTIKDLKPKPWNRLAEFALKNGRLKPPNPYRAFELWHKDYEKKHGNPPDQRDKEQAAKRFRNEKEAWIQITKRLRTTLKKILNLSCSPIPKDKMGPFKSLFKSINKCDSE